MFIERHAEGNYRTKHAETRLGSTILPYTYTYTRTQIHEYTHADTEIHNEGKEGRLSADTLASFVSVPLVGHAKWQVAGHIGMSARNVGGATNRDSLSTCHPDGAAMLVEVDATAVTELLLVRLIAKIREVIASLLVRNEVQQTQELVVNASRGRHAYRQKRHSAIVAIWIPILTNLFGSSLRKNLVGSIRVAEHAMALPTITTSADEVMTDSGIGKQVGMLQHADAKDRNVSTAFHFAGHHLLDVRDITRFLADATEGIQHVIMSTMDGEWMIAMKREGDVY